jgi:plasmid stabilization system protein ParE
VSLQVRTTPEAEAEIAAIDEWWRQNRRAEPDLFLEELVAAFHVIAYAPQIGRPYRRSPVPGTRRILLKACRYHVYYVPLASEARVLSVWHGQRGVGPPLRA